MHPSLLIYNDSLRNSIRTDFEIEVLDNSCTFSEGPIWCDDGYYLFSDIPENIICKIEGGKSKEIYLHNSGCETVTEDVYDHMKGSNGLAFYAGNLLICQHGGHGIAQYNGNIIEPFITGYGGRPFNSPNDIIVHSNGSIFFSDPPYGLNGQKLITGGKFQPVAGIYCWQNGDVQLVFDQYQYPNGVCLSPDETKLYACSNKAFERYVMQFEVNDLSKHHILCHENGDGIECDRKGNIYLCAKEGIVIVNNAGKRLGVIQLPTIPANICWGGKDKNDLFITARENIFLIRNLV